MTIPVCAVVSKNCYKEFLLLKYSLEQYHQCEWFLSCDEYSYNKLKELPSVNAYFLIESDECDHVLEDSALRDSFTKLILTKFTIAREGMKKYKSVLLIDTDMIFVNKLDDWFLSLFADDRIDGMLCQHMTEDPANEGNVGYFNVGMQVVGNPTLLDEWEELTSRHKELGLYFEQKPMEIVQRHFRTVNLPINYNLGWWKFNSQRLSHRRQAFNLQDNKIYIYGSPAINFHCHSLKELKHTNFGEFLIKGMFTLMDKCDNEKYREFVAYFERVKNEDL